MINPINDDNFLEIYKNINDFINNNLVGDIEDIKLKYLASYNKYYIKDIINIVKIRRLRDLGIISDESARRLIHIYLRYSYNKSNGLTDEGLEEIIKHFSLFDISMFELLDKDIGDIKVDKSHTDKIYSIVDEYGSFYLNKKPERKL